MSELNFIFGLGIFLFGMSQLENAIRKLGDARIRYWLRSNTSSKIKSVTTGIVTTALLQSSSMVSLLVLAFASAGLLPLVNAIGIILGANLGTTFTGWLVAILGFKLDLEALALPLFGIAAFIIAVVGKDSRINHIAGVAFGIGLLLFGLGVMKTSMEALPQQWDVSVLQGHHLVIYLVFGVVITFLVQSSSAVMMMALAALNAQFIALPEAVALIIGADLGTTSTTALGSLTGSSIKRQLALAHFIFNFIVDIAAFLFLLPVLPLLLQISGLSDPLYSLVAFHSLMNLIGLLVFIPFLDQFARRIADFFDRRLQHTHSLLERVSPDIVDAAMVAVRDTVGEMIIKAACNSLRIFQLKPEQLKIVEQYQEKATGRIVHQDFNRGYEELRNQEGQLLNYTAKIQAQPLSRTQAIELESLQMITRHIVFSNKNLKDIQQDLAELKHSSTASMSKLYEKHKFFQKHIYEKLIELFVGQHSFEFVLEELQDIQNLNDRHTTESNEFVQATISSALLQGYEISIQLNTNREIRHAAKTLIKAMDLWMRLDSPTAEADTEAALVPSV